MPSPHASGNGTDQLSALQLGYPNMDYYYYELGWYNFLMGRISTQWKEVQHRYYTNYLWMGKWNNNTGKKWATTTLLQKVWEVSWDLWDHRNVVHLKTTTPAKL
jgi:hypothetical protein